MIQPIQMELDLHLQKSMFENTAKNLEHTKKRLGETELTMNLRPHDSEEQYLIDAWEQKVGKLVGDRDVLPFPSRREVKKAWDKNIMIENSKKKQSKKYMTKEMWIEQNNRIIDRQTRLAKENILNRGKAFGGHGLGSIIKVVEPYNGLNSIYTGSRALVKKGGTGLKENTESSLPPWFHPAYYENAEKPKITKSNLHYKQPFISTSRGGTGMILNELRSVSRRRARVLDTVSQGGSSELWGSGSLDDDSVLSSLMVAEMLEQEDIEEREQEQHVQGKDKYTEDIKAFDRASRSGSRGSTPQEKGTKSKTKSFGNHSVIKTADSEAILKRSNPKRLPKVSTVVSQKVFKVKNYTGEALKYQQDCAPCDDFEAPPILTQDEFDEFGDLVVRSAPTKPPIVQEVNNVLLVSSSSNRHTGGGGGAGKAVVAAAAAAGIGGEASRGNEMSCSNSSSARVAFTSDIFRVKTRPKTSSQQQQQQQQSQSQPVSQGSGSGSGSAGGPVDVQHDKGGSPIKEPTADHVTVHEGGGSAIDSAAGELSAAEITRPSAAPAVILTPASAVGHTKKKLSSTSTSKSCAPPPTQKKLSEAAAKAERDAILSRPMEPIIIPKVPLKRPTETRKTVEVFNSDRCRQNIVSTTKLDVDLKRSKNPVATVDEWIARNGAFSSSILTWKPQRAALCAELIAVSTPLAFDAKGADLLFLAKNPYSAEDDIIRNNEGKETNEFIL